MRATLTRWRSGAACWQSGTRTCSASLPESDAARAETLAWSSANLTTHFPQWFSARRRSLAQRADRRTVGTSARRLRSAGTRRPPGAGGSVHHPATSDEGPRFTAAVLCFPSRWRLHEKIGKPLGFGAWAGAVLCRASCRPGRSLHGEGEARPYRVAAELVGAGRSGDVSSPPASGAKRPIPRSPPDNAGEQLYLRVERQTLRRLPQSDAMLFGIRVHCYPMARADHDSRRPRHGWREAVRALPEATVHYKSLKAYGPRCSPGWTPRADCSFAQQPVAERHDLWLLGGGARDRPANRQTPAARRRPARARDRPGSSSGRASVSVTSATP